MPASMMDLPPDESHGGGTDKDGSFALAADNSQKTHPSQLNGTRSGAASEHEEEQDSRPMARDGNPDESDGYSDEFVSSPKREDEEEANVTSQGEARISSKNEGSTAKVEQRAISDNFVDVLD